MPPHDPVTDRSPLQGCCASREQDPAANSPYESNVAATGEDDNSRARIARPVAAARGGHQTSASSMGSPDAAAAQSTFSSQSPGQQLSINPASPPQRDHRRFGSPASPRLGSATHQPNHPLNPPPPQSKVQRPPLRGHYDPLSNQLPPLSRAALAKERRDFFDTQVAGRPEIWAAVKAVCELVEHSNLVDAQAVLDASGCTCPSGNLWGHKGGVYDELGEKYIVPAWAVGEPPGVVPDGSDDGEKSSSNEEEDEDEEVSREKGKGKAVVVEEPDDDALKLRVCARE